MTPPAFDSSAALAPCSEGLPPPVAPPSISPPLFPSSEPVLKIFFASETGTARRIAEETQKFLQSQTLGFTFQVIDPSSFEPEDLVKEKFALFILSTWQHGSSPAHANFFIRWINESATDFRVGSGAFKHLRFGVFGLGSSSFKDSYNTLARSVDRDLKNLGAVPFVETCFADVDLGNSDVETKFSTWTENVLRSLREKDSLGKESGKGGGEREGETESEGQKEQKKSGNEKGERESGEKEREAGSESDEVSESAEESERDEEEEGEEEDEDEFYEVKESIADLEDMAGRMSLTSQGNGDVSNADWSFVGTELEDLGMGDSSSRSGQKGEMPHLFVLSGDVSVRGDSGDKKRNGGVKKKWFVKVKGKGGDGERSGEKKGEKGGKARVGSGGVRGVGKKDEGTNAEGEREGEEGRGPPLREMVTPVIRASLEKQGYAVIGSHSGVKICRWTKSQLRGRGGCYKHAFYGIESHRCMEATPSLACANKCVFCWRHHSNPVAKSWKWKMEGAEFVVERALEEHRRMVGQMKGVPGVTPARLEEGLTPVHCALSLVGEPIFYPEINKLIDLLHGKGISTFLVTNAQFPEKIRELNPVTQLYVSVDAATSEELKRIDRPLFSDFWERFQDSLRALKDKPFRTVYRLTLVKGWNMNEAEKYARILYLGEPDFIEIKGVTYCGSSKTSVLSMENVPYHEDVREFGRMMERATGGVYQLACEHAHSCCILLANERKFKKEGKWYTWIDYVRFQELVRSGESFSSADYMLPSPEWAVFGSEEAGFDPCQSRFRKERRHGSNKQSSTAE